MPVKITNDNADTTAWTGPTDAQGGPAACNALAKDSFGKLICAFVQIGGTGRVAWSNDSGATWSVGSGAASITLNDSTKRHIGLVVSSNRVILGYAYFSGTVRMVIDRWTITRDGSNNITDIAPDSVTTDASTGSGSTNWKFRKIELSPNSDEVVAMVKFGAAQAWLGFIRAKISDNTYKDLAGTASTMTLFEQGADQAASSFEIHPVTKDIWHMSATVGSAGNGLVSRYRMPYNSGTGNWTNTADINESVGGVGHFAQTDNMLNSCVDTVNNKLYFVVWNGKTGEVKYRLFVVEADGSTRSELTSTTSPGNGTVLGIALGAREGKLYFYGIDDNVFGVGTKQLFYRTWNGTSWSAATDLGDSGVNSIATYDGDVNIVYGKTDSNFWFLSVTLPDFNLTKLTNFPTAIFNVPASDSQTVAATGSSGVVGGSLDNNITLTLTSASGSISPATLSSTGTTNFTVSITLRNISIGDAVVTGSSGTAIKNLAFPFVGQARKPRSAQNLVIEYDSSGVPTGTAFLDSKRITINTASVGSLVLTASQEISPGRSVSQDLPDKIFVAVNAIREDNDLRVVDVNNATKVVPITG